MDVLILEVTDKETTLLEGQWGGLRRTVPTGKVTEKHRIRKMDFTQSKWSVEVKSSLPLIISNESSQDIEVSVNGVTHKVPYRKTECVPTTINITESFRTYCLASGLLTFLDFQKEFCRLFKISKSVEAQAYANKG